MKHTVTKLLLILLLAAAGMAKAQGYQSYFAADSTRLNIYVVCTDYDETYLLTINHTDTVHFNNQCYLRGFQQIAHNVFEYYYFRENTATGRLYRYIPSADEEWLLCDMSLAVGDAFSFNDFFGTHQVVVESVSYENEGKVIHLSDGWNEFVFHEGVFPDYYPIGFPGASFENEYDGCISHLLCEYKNGEQVFYNPNFESCDEHWFSVSETTDNSAKIYPTSLRSMETVHIETVEPILKVAVYDLYGREIPIVCDQKASCQWDLTISKRVSGIYIIKVTMKTDINNERIIVKTEIP